MKKTLSILSLLILWITPLLGNAQYSQDTEFATALEWMYDQWLTKYNTVEDFRPWDQLTRQESAKFFGAILSYVEVQDDWAIPEFNCNFSDSDWFDPTLASSITLVCDSWMMRGYDWKFHPHDILTKAEALAILTRTNGELLDESQTPRWSKYHAHMLDLWVTKETDLSKVDTPLTRYEAALLIKRWNFPPAFQEVPLDEKWKRQLDMIIAQEEQKSEVKDTLRSNYLRTE